MYNIFIKNRKLIWVLEVWGAIGGGLVPFWPPIGPRVQKCTEELVRWTPPHPFGSQNPSKIDVMTFLSAFVQIKVRVLGVFLVFSI